MPMRVVKIGMLMMLVCTMGGAFGQDARASLPETIKQGPGLDRVPVTSGDPMQREQLQKMFEMRQAKIRRDTQTLAQLSNELKQSVESSSSSVLSLDMIKKAEAIEKLAKSLKQQMKADQ